MERLLTFLNIASSAGDGHEAQDLFAVDTDLDDFRVELETEKLVVNSLQTRLDTLRNAREDWSEPAAVDPSPMLIPELP